MSDLGKEMSKENLLSVLHRTGYPPDQIDKIMADLPDPFYVDRDGAILQRHGVTLSRLTDLLGGSP